MREIEKEEDKVEGKRRNLEIKCNREKLLRPDPNPSRALVCTIVLHELVGYLKCWHEVVGVVVRWWEYGVLSSGEIGRCIRESMGTTAYCLLALGIWVGAWSSYPVFLLVF
ncbi:hypothetical protein LOAG_00238 [Loa loa]|uniref:Uncharacterized protein n=1 Tax=Loa loa TaxID=7209 RepID=A0A1S0UDS2_LOALO|nr:hypothetical protein LOAG_00238 [Loa loa]EFO28243.1 hypothetical protein LOAG_00238 [Loa loa]